MTPVFWQRRYPSANVVLLPGPRPVLVDTGFGPAAAAMLGWLAGQGVALSNLRVVNTHAHTDHVGGNYSLAQHGVPIAMSALDAAPIQARDPDACAAQFLAQPIEPFAVAHVLEAGDVIDTGAARWTVVPTPGHTAGHISLTNGDVLVLGDAMHGADLGWADLHHHPDALDWTAETLARLERLPARVGYSGHGPAIMDLPAAYARAQRRLQRFRDDRAQVVWHAAKRNFAHHLMMEGGVAEAALHRQFTPMPWLAAFGAILGLAPGAFLTALVAESVRADAAMWHDRALHATAPHDVPPAGWAQGPVRPAEWPYPMSTPAWR